MHGGNPARQGGFTYVALLIAAAIVGAGLASAGELWSQSERRESERELLFIGAEFRKAIERYYEQSPGHVKTYPQRLTDLLQDPRFPQPRRYLRKIYSDPITGKPDWATLEAPTGGIMGVRSASEAETLKKSGFSFENRELEGKRRYSEWRFWYYPLSTEAPKAAPRR